MKIVVFILSVFFTFSLKANECKNRGDLDIVYCDDNKDLVADLPKDTKKFKNPKNLVFAVNPQEDMDFLEEIYKPLTNYLSKCTGRKTLFLQVQSSAALLEAMRSGRLDIALFGSGTVPFAVNIAGAIPFATWGLSDNSPSFDNLIVIVKKDSFYQKLSDLKDKKVAHVSPTSNLGHMSPMVLFPKNGITPDKDYKIVFSGKYDQSLMGVLTGDYDAAVFSRILFEGFFKVNKYLNEDDFRIIYQDKEKFPRVAISHSYLLEPKLAEKIKNCFLSFELTPEIQKRESVDKFISTSYEKDWGIVREIAKKNKK